MNKYSPTAIADCIDNWNESMQEFQDWMRGNEMGNHTIDEVALLFEDATEKAMFIDAVVQDPGIKLFNTATDTVETLPISSRYDVHYSFLEVRDAGFRVECMNVTDGVSPLHYPAIYEMYRGGGQPVVVHFSFKVADALAYKEVLNDLKHTNAVMAQACRSTYGEFSYWALPNDELLGGTIPVCLKPRYNRRDAEPTPKEMAAQAASLPGTPPDTEMAGAPTWGGMGRLLGRKG